MSKRKTKEMFQNEVYELVKDEYQVLGEYKNAHTYLVMLHNKDNPHEVKIRPTDFLQGKRCKCCENKQINHIKDKNKNTSNNANETISRSNRKTHTMFVEQVYNLVGNDYEVVGIYSTSKQKIKITHNICNYTYRVTPNDFLKGRRCPLCAGNIRKTTEEFKQQVASLEHGQYVVLDEYINDKTKIRFKHMKCGNTYSTTPNTFLNGHRCPRCYSTNLKLGNILRNKGSRKYRLITPYLPPYEKSLGYLFPELIEEWSEKNHKNTFQVYSQSSKKAWWKCKNCNNEWETRISLRTSKQKSGCPVCNESKGEKRIRDYLNINQIKFIPQKAFDGLFGTGGGLMFYDFYLPKQNILIEFQGKQHYEFVEIIHLNKDNFVKQLEHDRRKREYAISNNIKLLEIPYWDYEKVEEIITDLLINSNDMTA